MVDEVLSWFNQNYTNSKLVEQPFGSYNSNATANGLNASIALDQTALGVEFVRYKADYHGFTGYGTNSYHLIYFQIEQPLPATSPSRFLQSATNSTGTGSYEGMAYTFQLKAASIGAPTTMSEQRNV